jgi:hypothetical protein
MVCHSQVSLPGQIRFSHVMHIGGFQIYGFLSCHSEVEKTTLPVH